jgi:uncharacterized protein
MNSFARNHLLCLVLAIGLVAGAGCKRSIPERPFGSDNRSTRTGLTKITIGRTPLWVEIADDDETRTLGLMYRKTMPEDEGMLFVFEHPQPLSFWMKNTRLPLEIAFVSADYRILNVLPMEPMDEKPRYNSAGPALYAIEANQGWFARHGIRPGDRVGFSPGD